jgi:hypothetical protein
VVQRMTEQFYVDEAGVARQLKEANPTLFDA